MCTGWPVHIIAALSLSLYSGNVVCLASGVETKAIQYEATVLKMVKHLTQSKTAGLDVVLKWVK